jgi:hypothetical protein
MPTYDHFARYYDALKGATITQDVEWLGEGQSIWHVRIDERSDGDRSSHHHERIGELGVELATIADTPAAVMISPSSANRAAGAASLRER